MKLAAVVLTSLLAVAACGTSPEQLSNEALAAGEVAPGYCDAVKAMLAASQEQNDANTESYAEAVESVAALASPNDSLVLWEYAALLRNVEDDPSDRASIERLTSMGEPVGKIVQRSTATCG